jgi:hypothetical protein
MWKRSLARTVGNRGRRGACRKARARPRRAWFNLSLARALPLSKFRCSHSLPLSDSPGLAGALTSAPRPPPRGRSFLAPRALPMGRSFSAPRAPAPMPTVQFSVSHSRSLALSKFLSLPPSLSRKPGSARDPTKASPGATRSPALQHACAYPASQGIGGIRRSRSPLTARGPGRVRRPVVPRAALGRPWAAADGVVEQSGSPARLVGLRSSQASSRGPRR